MKIAQLHTVILNKRKQLLRVAAFFVFGRRCKSPGGSEFDVVGNFKNKV